MAQIDAKSVEAQLRNGDISNIYYFFGMDISSVETFTKRLIKHLLGEMEEFALTKINGKEFNLPSFCTTLDAMPMMSEYNVILINDYNCDEQRDNVTKEMIQTLKHIPSQTIVIFNITGFDIKGGKKSITPKNKKLTEFAAKNGVLCEFPLQTVNELSKSIVTSVSRHGCTIRPDNAKILAEMCLSNTLMINNEIDKLCAYVINGEITIDIINLCVASYSNTTVYEFAKAVFDGKRQVAITILDELLAQRIDKTIILFAISGSFTDFYRAAIALKHRRNSQDLMHDFGYYYEFAVNNAMRDCRKMSIAKIRRCIKILRNTAVLFNSATVDGRIIFEKAITEMMI